MVSDYNYIYFERPKRVLKVPAHLMYYAPNLTDKDIGGSAEASLKNKGIPFINDPGIHGMVISFVERASNSRQVVRHCTGQLTAEPPPMAR